MDKSKGFQEVRERFASMKQERRNIMKRIGKGILALMITLTTLFSGIHIEPVFAAAPAHRQRARACRPSPPPG